MDGGALIEIVGVKIVINFIAIIIYITEKRELTGLTITASCIIIKKISLDKCDWTFEYIFNILSNKKIPFEHKKQVSFKILMDHVYVDLETTTIGLIFTFNYSYICDKWYSELFCSNVKLDRV